jgi:hypothetical protein
MFAAALGASRTCRDGGNDVNDPEPTSAGAMSRIAARPLTRSSPIRYAVTDFLARGSACNSLN